MGGGEMMKSRADGLEKMESRNNGHEKRCVDETETIKASSNQRENGLRQQRPSHHSTAIIYGRHCHP